ncbi:MAG: A/G-specific adenine glycosylase [Neomegalonema sp.]|nr:A/G-specific adenine glycosylase [Neomegalonema sp.]
MLSSPERAADALLDWYDRSARRLPWRAPPGASDRTPAYFVWLSEVMLQQTTVATVGPYFNRFIARWPRVQDLAAAPRDEVLAAWAGLGYYARARNLHACAEHVATTLGGAFPETEPELLKLPGVGPYTAAAIAAIAFDQPATPVDGNYERVLARAYAVETPLPDAKPEIRAHAEALTPQQRPGDFAQAMMDLGATICTPKTPACGLCPWMRDCAGRRAGLAQELPRKRAKAPKPTRYGVAYIAMDPNARLWLQKRPDKGLLGGMLGFPGSDWRETPPDDAEVARAQPFAAAWRAIDTEARHTFTHFHLRLSLRVARVSDTGAAEGEWVARERLDAVALPTLMAKAARLAFSQLDQDTAG